MGERNMISSIRTFIRHVFVKSFMRFYYVTIFGMQIHKTAIISLKAKLDKTYPKGIKIGKYTGISGGVVILTHDHIIGNKVHKKTVIGNNVFIGVNAIILPGVIIGNNVIVSAGSVVKKNVPDNCIVEGNPAKVIYENVSITKYGQLTDYIKRQKM